MHYNRAAEREFYRQRGITDEVSHGHIFYFYFHIDFLRVIYEAMADSCLFFYGRGDDDDCRWSELVHHSGEYFAGILSAHMLFRKNRQANHGPAFSSLQTSTIKIRKANGCGIPPEAERERTGQERFRGHPVIRDEGLQGRMDGVHFDPVGIGRESGERDEGVGVRGLSDMNGIYMGRNDLRDGARLHYDLDFGSFPYSA
jgi:hypothetical protein